MVGRLVNSACLGVALGFELQLRRGAASVGVGGVGG